MTGYSRTFRQATVSAAKPTVRDEPRKLIAIRLDAKVHGWLPKTAENKELPYQFLVNEILASDMRKAG